jgi:hypothetical protein
MNYIHRINELARKYARFFDDGKPGQILATICPYTFPIDYAAFGCADRALDSWDFEKDMPEFIKWSVRRHRAFMSYTDGLDNDYVPAINANFGYGSHSAYFTGADVVMGKETSWTHAWLDDWDKLAALRRNPDTQWFQRIMEAYDHLIRLNEGDYMISAFGNAGPGDMANAIRGNDLFTDLYDYPGEVHALMDKCTDAFIWLEEAIHSKIDAVNGSIVRGEVTANVWFPGHTPYLSEDFNDLLPSALFEEFGAAHTQRIIDHFGGAYIHHHAKGAHNHHILARMRGLSMLEQSWDPNCSPPIERLESILDEHNQNGDCLPLMVRCRASDVYRRIDAIKRGRVVLMLNVDSLDEARDVMRFIRKHSII